MKRIRNLAALSAFVALSGTSVYAADVDTSAPRHAREHRELTKEQAMQRASKRFDAADADHNGTLSGQELRAARQQHRDRMAERKHARDEKSRTRQGS